MTEGLDMSLEDIIKNNKKFGGSEISNSFRGRGRVRGRGHGRGRSFESGIGPVRRFDNRFTTRTDPYFAPQAVRMKEMLVGESSETGTKLYISNLDYAVTNEDIKVLFSDVGELKRYSIHYDRSGRSKGTAEVVYMRRSDAVAAMKRYNNVQLDGKPMKLELVGVNIVTPVPLPPMQKGILGNPSNASRSNSRGRVIGRGHESNRRPQKMVSAEDLDADLERYRLEAMNIN